MAYVDPRLQGEPAPAVPVTGIESDHTAHLDRAKGSDIAFLDQRLLAYRRQSINIVAIGVTENIKDPGLAPRSRRPHRALRLPARASRGCGAVRHIFKGKWEVYWREGDSERNITSRANGYRQCPDLPATTRTRH